MCRFIVDASNKPSVAFHRGVLEYDVEAELSRMAESIRIIVYEKLRRAWCDYRCQRRN